jgi:hypothetical protein
MESDAGTDDFAPGPSSARLGDDLCALAKDVTTLCINAALPLVAQEAVAALQDLACEFAANEDANTAAERLEHLNALQAGLPSGIRAEHDGP